MWSVGVRARAEIATLVACSMTNQSLLRGLDVRHDALRLVGYTRQSASVLLGHLGVTSVPVEVGTHL